MDIKFDVIGLTETWLKENNKDLYGLPGYSKPEHSCRTDRPGGGVALYLKSSIEYILRNDLKLTDNYSDSVFIEIDKSVYKTDKNIIVGCIYRPPGGDLRLFNSHMESALSTIGKENKLIYLMGDTNIDLLKSGEHTLTSDFLDVLYSHNLIPLITKPTRVTQTTATLIDNIFTNDFKETKKHYQGILYNDISDHYPIYHINTEMKKLCRESKTEWKRSINQNRIENFIDECSTMEWGNVINSWDAQIAYTHFHNSFSKLYDKCFPLKRTKSNEYSTRLPWLSDSLKECITKKNKLYVKQNVSKKDEDIKYYKKYKNMLSKVIKNSERKHYFCILEEHKSDAKKSWKILKSVLNRNKTGTINTCFKHNNKILENKQEISNLFNSIFVNTGKDLANKIPQRDASPSKFLKNRVIQSIFLEPVVTSEVDTIIKLLKSSSPGWDQISPQVVKKVKTSIIIPFTHVLNLSLVTGIFPKELKLANVVPIFKAGDVQVFTNYRPVSILPVFSKIMERIMYNRLLSFLNKYKIIYDYQFGFRDKHSTYLALITLTEKISEALESGKHVIGIFLDFSKAFDTINHEIMLLKLEHYGIRGVALDWFKSYLNDRQQYVTYNNCKSSTSNVNCGVPQGSILGPLLFILYINDLSNVALRCFMMLFADDSNLFYSGNDITELTKDINEELKNVLYWLEVNKLSLNVSKTHYIIFSSRNTTVSDIDIRVRDANINRLEYTNFLGVQIDEKLNWKAHINYINKKLAKSTGILLKARKYLPSYCLKTLYHTFAYPYLTYCIHVWGNACDTHLDPLVKTQKRLIRIIASAGYRSHTGPLFRQLGILNLRGIYQYLLSTFMYRLRDKDLPKIFDNFCKTNSEIHSYCTRQVDDYFVPPWRLDIRKRSPSVQAPLIWNELPLSLKTCKTLANFKICLKKHLVKS